MNTIAPSTAPHTTTTRSLCSRHPVYCIFLWVSAIFLLLPGIPLWIFYWPIDATHSRALALRCIQQATPASSPDCIGGSMFDVFVPKNSNSNEAWDITSVCMYSSMYIYRLNSEEKSALVGCRSSIGVWFSISRPPSTESASYQTIVTGGYGIASTFAGVLCILLAILGIRYSRETPAEGLNHTIVS